MAKLILKPTNVFNIFEKLVGSQKMSFVGMILELPIEKFKHSVNTQNINLLLQSYEDPIEIIGELHSLTVEKLQHIFNKDNVSLLLSYAGNRYDDVEKWISSIKNNLHTEDIYDNLLNLNTLENTVGDTTIVGDDNSDCITTITL